MISQIFVLGPRGDILIFRDFKSDIPKSSTEVFFRKAKFWDGKGKNAPPAFQADGVQYLHIKVAGLFWVATTRENVSPSLVLELLQRIYWIARDYFGHVSEEVIRKNFLLVYELLDEILDYGLPQNSSTERLKQFIVMEPLVVKPRVPSGRAALRLGGSAAGPTEVVKSVLDTARTGAKEEIFVDIVEKLTAIFDAGGHQKSGSIVGAIQVKSYLTGNPPIKVGLSENLILGKRDQRMYSSYGSESDLVVLDSYSLHENVDQQAFDGERVMQLVPPEGHFALMTYRSSRSFRPPFRVYPLMEDDMYSGDKLTLYLRLLAEYPPTKAATGVEVVVPMPRAVQRVHFETDSEEEEGRGKLLPLPGKGGGAAFEQSAEWLERERKVVWGLKHLKGGREHTLRARLTLEPGSVEQVKRDYGPIMLHFVLPGKPSASGLDVKYMRILKEEKGYNPARWFRVVAMANSYQIRPHT
ncbi:hypothetical protein N2152v2_007809 [Parachlorella kessleri]